MAGSLGLWLWHPTAPHVPWRSGAGVRARADQQRPSGAQPPVNMYNALRTALLLLSHLKVIIRAPTLTLTNLTPTLTHTTLALYS